jgi:hypothetical protein
MSSAAGTTSAGGATNSAGASSGGSAGKGGSSAGGSGGASNGGAAGKGGSGGTVSSGGSTSTGTCDAAHSVATIATGSTYTGKANQCVRLSVNPTWATVKIEFQPSPGTTGYPIPYSFSSCAGSGTGSLTADYAESVMTSGANPGCDFYVQFTGGATTLKVVYYD